MFLRLSALSWSDFYQPSAAEGLNIIQQPGIVGSMHVEFLFGDVFNTEGVMPLACKETSNVIEMGVTIGLTL